MTSSTQPPSPAAVCCLGGAAYRKGGPGSSLPVSLATTRFTLLVTVSLYFSSPVRMGMFSPTMLREGGGGRGTAWGGSQGASAQHTPRMAAGSAAACVGCVGAQFLGPSAQSRGIPGLASGLCPFGLPAPSRYPASPIDEVVTNRRHEGVAAGQRAVLARRHDQQHARLVLQAAASSASLCLRRKAGLASSSTRLRLSSLHTAPAQQASWPLARPKRTPDQRLCAAAVQPALPSPPPGRPCWRSLGCGPPFARPGTTS